MLTLNQWLDLTGFNYVFMNKKNNAMRIETNYTKICGCRMTNSIQNKPEDDERKWTIC